MPVDKDDIMFGETSFSDILSEIHTNQKDQKNQIHILINELRVFIKDMKDAALVVPLIKEYLDISVKNDDHLIKLSQIYQRYIAASNRIYDSDDNGILSDQEKIDLVKTVREKAEIEINELGILESDKKFVEDFEDLITKTDDVLKSRADIKEENNGKD